MKSLIRFHGNGMRKADSVCMFLNKLLLFDGQSQCVD